MRILLPTIILLASFAGCFSDEPAPEETREPMPAAPVPATHVLVDAVEPDGLQPPAFRSLGAIAAGGPAYGAGEPSIWADLDGRILVAFPGCDRAFYLVGLPTDTESCGNGLVYASDDEGSSWARLNRDGDGRYTEPAAGSEPNANNDADVAVDAAGTVWASNLGGGGIQLHKQVDGVWEYVANVVPTTEDPDDDPAAREGADRQWLAAAGPGHVINTWMRTSPNRDVAINTTFDGGKTWTGRANFGDGIGWLGTVQFAPDGMTAYIPYTQPKGGAVNPVLGGGQECGMHVIKTSDGGRAWTDIDTGARWRTTTTGTHWSCVHMAPAIDVSGDGSVLIAYSIDNWLEGGFGVEHAYPVLGQSLMAIISRDAGQTWTLPTPVGPRLAAPTDAPTTAIMPWVTGGAGDRFAITYLHTITLADQDYAAAAWDVRALIIDDFELASEARVDSLIEANVHVGGICTRGGTCLLTGSDRAFLDFFEADLMPDGRLVVTYPHDLNPTKMIEIRVAIQDGGTPLLQRP